MRGGRDTSFEPRRRGASSGVDAIPLSPRWGLDGPPTEAYSRVSDPERYRPLHAFASALADDLAIEFDIERDDEPVLDREFTAGVDVVRAIRLSPNATDAAPITIGFTAFPGLVLGFGEFTRSPVPVCGCDACDDQLVHLVESAREEVDAVVSGGFAEASGGWASFRTVRSSSVGGSPGPHGPRRAWAPWPRRARG